MGFDAAFGALMPHTVTVSSITGVSTDGHGTPTYGTGTAYTALVQDKQQEVITVAGHTAVSRSIAWIKSTSTFDVSDRFELSVSPGEYPAVLVVANMYDQDGLHHVKVWFGDRGNVVR